jgi:cytidylate kinase
MAAGDETEAAPQRHVVIAIDGPAASGKGTIARRLAARRGYAHLDTGLLYRAVAALVLEAGADPADAAAAEATARALDLADLHRSDLRNPATGAASSVVAAHPGVRQALLDYQRFFAGNPRGGAAGVVLDGRDIGTVVCPEANVKLFVTASVDERARRRAAELAARGEPADVAAVRADIEARDARDRSRPVAPLAAAADAILLDTTELDIEAAVAAAARLVSEALERRGA